MTAPTGPKAAAAATMAVDDPQLKAFLASALFVLPWLTWQAWVLGSSFRQRRGKPVADTNALAESAAALQAAAAAAKAAALGTSPDGGQPPTARETGAAPNTPSRLSRGRPLVFMLGVSLVYVFAKAWLARVLATVPEPYLDEVFHIPQAQAFCAGRWHEWDDKITTPPGLYLVSVALQSLWNGVDDGCSVWALRGANTVAVMLVAVVASACRSAAESLAGRTSSSSSSRASSSDASFFSLYAFHSGLNIALFPVLFFFCALYYTDVYSTLAVLLAYRVHLYRSSVSAPAVPAAASPPLWTDAAVVVVGLATLLMRQTNVFWVVVYCGGLEAVQAVKAGGQRNARVLAAHADDPFDSAASMLRLYAWRYALGGVHDPPLGAGEGSSRGSTAWPDDWLLTLTSLGVAAASRPLAVLRRVWAHVAVLAAFGGFVAWNGGVVLGDKANHVATLHLAQLLYLFPLLSFFSAPLVAVHGWHYVRRMWRVWVVGEPQQRQRPGGELPPPLTTATFPEEEGADRESKKSEKSKKGSRKLLLLLHAVFVSKLYYPVYVLGVFNAMLAVVRYNTVVHPFTLADNRHYMFYVFRYTIRRIALARYLLVPVYTVCAWACWRVFWGVDDDRRHAEEQYINSPFVARWEQVKPVVEDATLADEEPAKPTRPKKTKKGRTAAAGGAPSPPLPPPLPPPPGIFLSLLDEDEDGAASAARAPAATSQALLWLLATALSLVTAPLVEPRYFILPWVFWRLLVPATGGSANAKVDLRLVLETAWFVLINAATMYVFLYRPFVWRAADGTLLDGGRLQRFMW